jgi:putative transcriptional regulator
MKLPRGTSAKNRNRGRGYLDGQMLIAMPAMLDERFARSLIYVCAHSSEGAMGIVVNHPAPNINFSDLLVKLDVIPAADVIQLPSRAGVVKVMRGGPVETERGFVLHSADFFIENSTLPIDEGICLTATLDILKAIARGDGPASAILALGYAGWAPGQLESEIQGNGWLHCRAGFGTDFRHRYRRQIRKGAEEDRHRSRHAVERGRARLAGIGQGSGKPF